MAGFKTSLIAAKATGGDAFVELREPLADGSRLWDSRLAVAVLMMDRGG